MVEFWSQWKMHLKRNPRAHFEAIVGIALFLALLQFLFRIDLSGYILALVIILSVISKRIRIGFGFLWWMTGLILGRVTSPVVLVFLYFLVLTPWSLIFRLFNRDHLRIYSTYSSQWRGREHQYTRSDFENPF